MIESTRILSSPRSYQAVRPGEKKGFDQIDGGSRQLDDKLEEDEQ